MSILSSAAKIVDGVGKSLKLKSTLVHKVLLTDLGKGDPAYSDVSRKAFVDKKQRLVRSFDGQEVMSTATIVFASPSILVKEGDVIKLDDGSGGPVIGVSGYIDGATNRQAFSEVYIG